MFHLFSDISVIITSGRSVREEVNLSYRLHKDLDAHVFRAIFMARETLIGVVYEQIGPCRGTKKGGTSSDATYNSTQYISKSHFLSMNILFFAEQWALNYSCKVRFFIFFFLLYEID